MSKLAKKNIEKFILINKKEIYNQNEDELDDELEDIENKLEVEEDIENELEDVEE